MLLLFTILAVVFIILLALTLAKKGIGTIRSKYIILLFISSFIFMVLEIYTMFFWGKTFPSSIVGVFRFMGIVTGATGSYFLFNIVINKANSKISSISPNKKL